MDCFAILKVLINHFLVFAPKYYFCTPSTIFMLLAILINCIYLFRHLNYKLFKRRDYIILVFVSINSV